MFRSQILFISLISIFLFSCAATKRKEEERLRKILEASAAFHIERSYTASDSGNIKGAKIHLKKALAIAPWHPLIYNNLGVLFFKEGQVDSALFYYKFALRKRPSYIYAYSNMAQVYLSQENYQMAHLAVNNGLERKPEAEDLYILRANIYERQNLYDEAILNYKHVLTINPNNESAHNNIGTLYQSKGLLQEAIDSYHKSIELNPNNIESYFNLGNAYAHKCQLELALDYYSSALELQPDLFSAYNNRGLLYTSLNKHNLALYDFSKSFQLAPQSPIIPFNLSIVYQRLDSLDKALEFAEMAIQSDTSNALFYMQKGNILAAQQQYQDALPLYLKAVKIDASKPIIFNNMGNVYFKIEQTALAQNAFETAAELYPDYLDARYYSLNKSRKSGQIDLAGSCTSFNSIATDYANIYNNLGKTFLKQNSLNKAISAFEQSTKIQPNFAEAFENMAACYQLKGQQDLARFYLAQSRLLVGKYYYSIDSLQTARETVLSSIQLRKDYADAYAVLGLILEKEGQIAEAENAFANALKLDNFESDFYFEYGDFLSRRDQWKNAVDKITIGLAENPNSIKGRNSLALAFTELGEFEKAQKEQAQVHFLTGKRYEYAGQWDSALDEYLTAEKIDSTNADYLASQGLIFAKKHQQELAKMLFHKALKFNSQNALALYGMGLVLGEQQKNKEAIKYLKQSIAANPSEAQVHYVLAVNYYFSGNIDLAWFHVLQAQNLGKIVKQQFLDELLKAAKAGNE